MVGQVKSVKTVLKQLQQSIQTITTPGMLKTPKNVLEEPSVGWVNPFRAFS